jgi:hypothetical protein
VNSAWAKRYWDAAVDSNVTWPTEVNALDKFKAYRIEELTGLLSAHDVCVRDNFRIEEEWRGMRLFSAGMCKATCRH